MTNDLGRVLAERYRLTELLGQGGAGAVWRARDDRSDRDVAIKELRLPEHLDADLRADWIARIDREARAAARLNHPGIITVHDRIATEDGRSWIVMELVEGGSLADLVRTRGPLPPDQAAAIGTQILSALRTAHEAGITHRDIKPANILLQGGRVVLTDFGIAALEGDTTLTRSGAVMGTPAYMSPEQVQGERATAASDLWSLGATLYTATEGRPPFEGASTGAVFVAIATRPPAPATRAGPLGPVIGDLLRKDPGERPTADRLHASLVQARQPDARPATPPAASPWQPPPGPAPQPPGGGFGISQTPGRRRKVVLAAIIAAAVVLITGGTVTGYALYQRSVYEPGHRVIEDLGTPDRFTLESEEEIGDGKVRARYAKSEGRCDGCLTNGDSDAIREWLLNSPYVRSVGTLQDTQHTGCARKCTLPVEPRGDPGVLSASVAGASLTVTVEIVVG